MRQSAALKMNGDIKMKKSNSFSYSYSALEQEEIKRIREKYTEKEKALSKLDLVKKLDKSVTDVATAVALAFGIFGVLVMGTGMSLVLVWGDIYMVPGIVTGVLGIILAGLAYPIYNKVLISRRKKIAPQIIKLTDELIDQSS